jgi:hypothetical protein
MPNSRKEFERNMHFLNEGFEKDRVMISQSSLNFIKGIQNARLAPNQRANLKTVDQMAGLLANSTARMMQQEEFKNTKDVEK